MYSTVVLVVVVVAARSRCRCDNGKREEAPPPKRPRRWRPLAWRRRPLAPRLIILRVANTVQGRRSLPHRSCGAKSRRKVALQASRHAKSTREALGSTQSGWCGIFSNTSRPLAAWVSKALYTTVHPAKFKKSTQLCRHIKSTGVGIIVQPVAWRMANTRLPPMCFGAHWARLNGGECPSRRQAASLGCKPTLAATNSASGGLVIRRKRSPRSIIWSARSCRQQ